MYAYMCTRNILRKKMQGGYSAILFIKLINSFVRMKIYRILFRPAPTDSPSPQQGRLPLPWPCDKADSVQGAPVTQETLFHHDFLSIQPQHHPTCHLFHPNCPCLTSSILPITRGKLFWRRGPPSQVYQQFNFGFQPIAAGSISGKHC